MAEKQADLLVSTNEQIKSACCEMEVGDKITFITDHFFVENELKMLTLQIALQRNGKEGSVSLLKYLDVDFEKIDASCFVSPTNF